MSEVLSETFIRYHELNLTRYQVKMNKGRGVLFIGLLFSINVQNMVSLQVGESWSIDVYAC